MRRLRAKVDYEALREARISENQARLASLGIAKSLSDLQAITSPVKAVPTPQRKYQKTLYDTSSLRRSSRLKGKSPPRLQEISRSEHVRTRSFGKSESTEERLANAPVATVDSSQVHLPEVVLVRRCKSKSRGSVYDHFLGICCHFCRQKKLCGEEDCRRCGYGEIEQPCIGKTDCSICHSSKGVLCRACLKVRYGEEMDEVRNNKDWMCPHCIEEKGVKPYWICNSSLCLKKRKIPPTGIAIYEAREQGFESVAHLLMDQLKRGARSR